MNISCNKREKTPKCSEKQAEKAKNFIDVAWFWTMKNILLMMAQTCKETTTNTRMTKCPDSVPFAGKEKYPDKVMVCVAIFIGGISQPSTNAWRKRLNTVRNRQRKQTI